MPHVKKAPLSLETVERLAKEMLNEAVEDYASSLERLTRSKPGTRRHDSALADLSVAASWLEIKGKSVQDAIDEYIDSLPGDDDED